MPISPHPVGTVCHTSTREALLSKGVTRADLWGFAHLIILIILATNCRDIVSNILKYGIYTRLKLHMTMWGSLPHRHCRPMDTNLEDSKRESSFDHWHALCKLGRRHLVYIYISQLCVCFCVWGWVRCNDVHFVQMWVVAALSFLLERSRSRRFSPNCEESARARGEKLLQEARSLSSTRAETNTKDSSDTISEASGEEGPTDSIHEQDCTTNSARVSGLVQRRQQKRASVGTAERQQFFSKVSHISEEHLEFLVSGGANVL